MRDAVTVCIVIDCRRTGRPLAEGRDFICHKHLAKADDQLLTTHAHAASQARSGPAHKRRHGEFRERMAWDQIRKQVAERCQLKL
jgi:hypothetical protein